MGAIPKNVIREIIKENDFKNPIQVYAYLRDGFKDVIQEMLEAEMDVTLGYDKNDVKNKQTDNYRNGHTEKTVKSQYGEIDLKISRDKNGEHEPQIVPKFKRDISGIEEKVISLYARSMSTRDIHYQIKEWQNRPFEPIYPFVFMDAVHYKIKEDSRIINKAAYVVLGISIDGNKDILGIWIGENKSSKFWLGILNELKNRGVEDVLIFCVDGLTGLKEAISAAFPKSEVQRCIIHQLRISFKYVSYKYLKAFSRDFRGVYTAASEELALDKLYGLKDKWGKQYPFAIRSWENNWDVLSPFFKYTEEVRKIIYTTNIIEGIHRQFRKVIKSKSMFPSDGALEKMLYLTSLNVMKKWTIRYKNWDRVLSQL